LPVPELGAAHRLQRVRERGIPIASAHAVAGSAGPQHRADQAAGGRFARRGAIDAERTFRRHGASRGAGARDRVRPDADPLRRAIRGAGPDRAQPGAAADPHAQSHARHHLDPGRARAGGGAPGRRSRIPDRQRQTRRARYAGRTGARGHAVDAAVLRRRSRRTGAVPLSGAGLRERSGVRRRSHAMNAQLQPRRNWLVNGIAQVGECGLFFLAILAALPKSLRYLREICRQVWFVGAMSLVIVMTCGLFTGMVLALQLYYTLSIFGGTAALGTVVALALFRELGPVLTAILVAGRAGTAVTAEIGLMRATDQIDAMEMMAVDPMAYIVAPRYLAGVIAMP